MHSTTPPAANVRADHDSHEHGHAHGIERGSEHSRAQEAPPIRLLVLDGSMFDAELLQERLLRDNLRELGLDIPFVILTADIDEATLAAPLRAGAVDYVFKSRLGRLTQALRLAIERARPVRHLHARTRDMARLSLDLIQAREAERKGLARELHDELGQRLSALNLLLHRSLPYFQAGAAHRLWRQAETDMSSLVELVLEISVFRLVQESVTNIVRHTRARQVAVEINGGAAGEEMEMIVRDDGVGFDTSCWREHGARERRAGLIGMSERVQLLGASFDAGSAPGRGSRIAANLPLHSLET